MCSIYFAYRAVRTCLAWLWSIREREGSSVFYFSNFDGTIVFDVGRPHGVQFVGVMVNIINTVLDAVILRSLLDM